MVLDIEKLKLKSNTDFFNALKLLEQLPLIQTDKPTFLEEKLISFRQEVVNSLNNSLPQEKVDNQYLKKRALFHFFGDENIGLTDIIQNITGDNRLFKFQSTLFKRENFINLISGGWGTDEDKYSDKLDKETLLKSKNSLPFTWLEKNATYTAQMSDTNNTALSLEESFNKIKEISNVLINRYGCRAITLNSLDTAQEQINKLSTLAYSFEAIAQNLNIEPKNIGMGKLDMHMGNLLDDCNGWMMFDDDGDNHIAITQKANETIIIHEWMHWFDSNIQENPDFKQLIEPWGEHRNQLIEGDFEKNEFDLKLFDKFSPESFINRFASNHVNPVYKNEFAQSLSELNTLFKNFVEKANNPSPNNSKKDIKKDFSIVKESQEKFMKDYGNEKYFPHKDFLHRYMSFLKADFQILNDIIQGTIETKKSVFNHHASLADAEFGHHYSGNKQELTARSFEAYLEDTSSTKLPLDSNTTLWYPKNVERRDINLKWEKFFALAPTVMGKYTAPNPKEVTLLASCGVNISPGLTTLPIKSPLLISSDNDIISKRQKIKKEVIAQIDKDEPTSNLKTKINKLRTVDKATNELAVKAASKLG